MASRELTLRQLEELENNPVISLWELALETKWETTQDKEKLFELGRIWTHNLQIRSLLLYQLSYEARQEQADA